MKTFKATFNTVTEDKVTKSFKVIPADTMISAYRKLMKMEAAQEVKSRFVNVDLIELEDSDAEMYGMRAS